MESEKSAYAAVVREQEKQISAAADAVQRTKEDLNLSQDTDTLEEQLKNLRACAENGGVYRARIHRCSWTAECDRRYGDCGGHRGHAG